MYNLAEFKEWLENKDSLFISQYQQWLTNLQEPAKWELFLQGIRFLNNDPQQYFAGQGITDLGQEWKAEVDTREGIFQTLQGVMMFNFTEFKQWFNTQFTTEEAKVQAGGSNYQQWLTVLETPANWEKAWQGKARENLQNPLIGLAMQNTISQWVKEAWQREIASLKAKLAEYENEETSSQVSSESSYNDLTAKLAQKRAELQTALIGGRRSTAHLRKEIELLERIQRKEERIRELEQRITELNNQVNELQGQNVDERVGELTQRNNNLQTQVNSLQQEKNNWQTQIQQKTQELNQKQTQLNNKQTELNQQTNQKNQLQQQVNSLQGQINSLTSEKRALEERVLMERQEALKGFAEEKEQLEKELKSLQEQKDTFQKSADYLRETLKGTEKTLEEIKKELAQTYEDKLSVVEEKDKLLEEKEEELRQRNEGFKTIQERNASLTEKLSSANGEISQLSEWIGKLESVSGEGDLVKELKKELELSQAKVQELQKQLNSKQPRSYWWVYVLVALVGVWLVVK